MPGRPTDEDRLLSRVPEDGSAIGNARLRELLRWDEEKYKKVRDRLVERGALVVGRGQGGAVKRPPEDNEVAAEASNQTSSNGTSAKRRGRLSDVDKFVSYLPEDGSPILNKNLREQLDWDATKYDRIKAQLISQGTIVVGKGPGGSVRLVESEDEEFLAQVPPDGSDITISKLDQALGWNPTRFAKARERLLEKGIIEVPSGRGKHSCIRRVSSNDASPEETPAPENEVGASDAKHEVADTPRATPNPTPPTPTKHAQARPTVFIGSSREGLRIAHAIQYGLQYDVDCTIWSQGVFGLSGNTLEGLVKACKKFDFAVLVLTPDDLTTKREVTRNAPRDNVLFELGLFMGTLGRERTFMVHCSDEPIDLPTDLAGITPATFVSRADGNWKAAVGPVCMDIKDAIKEALG